MRAIIALVLPYLVAAVTLSAQHPLTWVKRTTGFTGDYTITSATVIRDRLNVVGYRSLPGGGFESRIARTSDGFAWTGPVVLSATGIVRSITFGFTSVGFATVEDSNAANLNRMLVSEDGVTWIARPTGTGSLVSVATNFQSLVIAVGSANGGNNVVRSADNGTTWTRINTGRAIDLTEVAYGNNRFLAISRSGTLLSSTTGTTWSEVPVPGLPAGAIFSSLTSYDGRFFLLVNDSTQRPRVFVSADGATWAASGPALDAPLANGAIATNGAFLAVAANPLSPGPGLIYASPFSISLGLVPGTAPIVGTWPATPQVVDATGTSFTFLKSLGFWMTGGANGTFYTAGSVFGSPPAAPVISAQPAAQSAVLGSSATFSFTATDSGGGLGYQWFRNGARIAGATNATYTIANASVADVGSYFVLLSYGSGSVFSQPAEFTLDTRGTLATITKHPAAQSVPVGAPAVFNVDFTSQTGATFQWLFNGNAIPGAITSSYLIPNVLASHAGTYSVIVANSAGGVTSNTAVLTVTPALSGRLINLSVLTEIATATDEFTLGYVVGGVGTSGLKPLLIRAAGPSLGALGVPGTLDDPKLETFAGAIPTGSNDNWGGNPQLASAFGAVGAFPYTGPASRDAAITTNLTTRDNSVKVTGVGGHTGTVIAEIYDATPAAAYGAATPRLLNVSVRKHLGTGLTAGFVLQGTQSTRVLIRAIGPGLAAFGVPDTVVDPQLALFNDKSVKIAENNDWGGTGTLTSTFAQVGAFDLPGPNSKDAALFVSLLPGGYSIQVTGVNNTTGVALVEVYEVP